jgi:hypothetical protein
MKPGPGKKQYRRQLQVIASRLSHPTIEGCDEADRDRGHTGSKLDEDAGLSAGLSGSPMGGDAANHGAALRGRPEISPPYARL